MTSVIESSASSGSSGPRPVTSSIISSTRRQPFVARHRELVDADDPVDDPLDLGAHVGGVLDVELRIERPDRLGHQAQPDLAEHLLAGWVARRLRPGGDQGAARIDGSGGSARGGVLGLLLGPLDPLTQGHAQYPANQMRHARATVVVRDVTDAGPGIPSQSRGVRPEGAGYRCKVPIRPVEYGRSAMTSQPKDSRPHLTVVR